MSELKNVSSADSVINFLENNDLKKSAVIIKNSFKNEVPTKFIKDSLAN